MLGSIKNGNAYVFKTYAPNAKKVELYIDGQTHEMSVEEGYWSIELVVEDNTVYSYIIDGVRKCDPYAQKVIEIIKGNPEAVTYNSQYRFEKERQQKPISDIYEVYLRKIPGDTYQEKASYIAEHAKDFSHIQIMPFNYTPNKKTLGYKTSTYFAPEPKYGDLDDLKEMIDILHGQGFGVILDFSIFEFEEFSNTGLKMYDGSTLFERADKKQHEIFTGFFFDIEKPFVKQFLKNIVHFLLEDLQADGVRIDGVNEVIFINKGYSQDINEKGLEFIKEIINEVPQDRIVLADLLTHYKLKDLGLERLDGVEANMFMFQVQNIMKQGKEWFETNREREIKLLYDTLMLLRENKNIATFNHDIHINGIEDEIENAGFKTEKEYEFLKSLVYALPVSKQLYYSVDIQDNYKTFFNSMKEAQFSFSIYNEGALKFEYTILDKHFQLFFEIFEQKITLIESTQFTLM